MASDRHSGDDDPRKGGGIGPHPTEPHRENVPGELDHASGEVEEFEAALISGAEGESDEDDVDAELDRRMQEPVGDLDDDGDVDEDDRALAGRPRILRSPAAPASFSSCAPPGPSSSASSGPTGARSRRPPASSSAS